MQSYRGQRQERKGGGPSIQLQSNDICHCYTFTFTFKLRAHVCVPGWGLCTSVEPSETRRGGQILWGWWEGRSVLSAPSHFSSPPLHFGNTQPGEDGWDIYSSEVTYPRGARRGQC